MPDAIRFVWVRINRGIWGGAPFAYTIPDWQDLIKDDLMKTSGGTPSGIHWGRNFWAKGNAVNFALVGNVPVPREAPLNTPEWATCVVWFPEGHTSLRLVRGVLHA